MRSTSTVRVALAIVSFIALSGCSAPTAAAPSDATVRMTAFGHQFAVAPVVVMGSGVREAEVRIEYAQPDTVLWANRGDRDGTYRVRVIALRKTSGETVYEDSTPDAGTLLLFRADEAVYTPLRVNTVGVASFPSETSAGRTLPPGQYTAVLQIRIVATTNASFAVLSEISRSIELTVPIQVR